MLRLKGSDNHPACAGQVLQNTYHALRAEVRDAFLLCRVKPLRSELALEQKLLLVGLSKEELRLPRAGSFLNPYYWVNFIVPCPWFSSPNEWTSGNPMGPVVKVL